MEEGGLLDINHERRTKKKRKPERVIFFSGKHGTVPYELCIRAIKMKYSKRHIPRGLISKEKLKTGGKENQRVKRVCQPQL